MLLLSEKLMSCCAVGTNVCLDMRRRATAFDRRVSAEWIQMFRLHARRPRDSVAPLRRNSAGWMPVLNFDRVQSYIFAVASFRNSFALFFKVCAVF